MIFGRGWKRRAGGWRRAAPRPDAAAVGEELPGKALEARRGGLLGAKGFFELRRDGRTVYLSEQDAAPVPLTGAAMVVAAENVRLGPANLQLVPEGPYVLIRVEDEAPQLAVGCGSLSSMNWTTASRMGWGTQAPFRVPQVLFLA